MQEKSKFGYTTHGGWTFGEFVDFRMFLDTPLQTQTQTQACRGGGSDGGSGGGRGDGGSGGGRGGGAGAWGERRRHKRGKQIK